MRVKDLEEEAPSCLVVGNYCHDVLMKDSVVLAESLGGAVSFISAVLDGVTSVEYTFVGKVGSDFAYPVAHSPLVCASSRTTLFHANFSSQIQRQDRILRRIHACDPIEASILPNGRRFEFGLAVGVGGEILPETLEKIIDLCGIVLVDIQALIRVFDSVDGTVTLMPLRDSGFYHLIPRIGFLKASSEEAPLIDLEDVRKKCCVVITNGEHGCTVYYRDGEQQIAPFTAVQVDPTGAGDSFLGGLLVGLAHGLAVPDAALLGNFFGSLTVGQLGLPKFDSRSLQVVADELHRKRSQKRKKELIFTKPSDHLEFHALLDRAKDLPVSPVQECQWESTIAVEHPNHHTCSNQPRLFPSSQ